MRTAIRLKYPLETRSLTHAFSYRVLSRFFITAKNPKSALYTAELGRARALADLMATQYSTEMHSQLTRNHGLTLIMS